MRTGIFANLWEQGRNSAVVRVWRPCVVSHESVRRPDPQSAQLLGGEGDKYIMQARSSCLKCKFYCSPANSGRCQCRQKDTDDVSSVRQDEWHARRGRV